MRSAVGLLCVLSALVPTGDCISCVACIELGSTCRGKSMVCPPGTVCGTSFLKVSDMLKGVIRSCFQKSDCKKNGTFSVDEYKGKQMVSCCATDNCTPPKPTWNESSDIKLNGLMCPSCVSFSNDCFDTDQVSCSGDEKFCFTQYLRGSGQRSYAVTLSGCATESLCQMGNGSVNLDPKTNSTAHCTKANITDSRTTELTVTSALQTNSTRARTDNVSTTKLAATVMATIKSGDRPSNAGSPGTSSSTSILHSPLASILFLCQAAILLSLSSINLS